MVSSNLFIIQSESHILGTSSKQGATVLLLPYQIYSL